MLRGDQMAGAGGDFACAANAQRWLVIGPLRERDRLLLRSLAQFGISAVAADGDGMPGPASPVLCDARNAGFMQRLLHQVPQRRAPLVFRNVSLGEARARLLLAGADDAVSTRVAPCELAARMIAAVQARARALGSLSLAGFSFDTGLRQVRWRDRHMRLMPREFDLLLELARRAGDPVSRQALLQSVWQTGFDPGTNSLEVHVCKLRRRLAPLGEAVRIETVKGCGYRLVTR